MNDGESVIIGIEDRSSPWSDGVDWRADDYVDICNEDTYPAIWDTFKGLYALDGNHPSEQGTYLQGLIIASAMTGVHPHPPPHRLIISINQLVEHDLMLSSPRSSTMHTAS